MKKLLGLSAALALVVLVMPGFAGDEKGKGEAAKCICPDMKATSVAWCAHCKDGKAFGQDVKSEKLVTALSGKEVKEADLKCADCKAVLKAGGTCTKCKITYLNGKQYQSPVAASLAKGTLLDKAKVTCAGCKALPEKGGICPQCGAAVFSGMVFKGKEDYDKAVRANSILATAVTTKCEDCAVAIVTDGKCEKDKATYKDGRKAEG